MLGIALLSATFSFADIHPGLKAAIDKGDMKTAKNLIEKLGIKDIYCPSGMKIDNFKKIYADTLSKSADIPRYFCDSLFWEEYGFTSCKGKSELDSKVCALWTEKANTEKVMQIESFYCNNKQTVEACNNFLLKVPIEKAITYYEKAFKNKLFEPIYVTEEYEKDIYEEKKRTKSECRNDVESIYNSALKQCDNNYTAKLHADEFHRQNGGRTTGNAEVERTKCYRDVKSTYQKMQNMCLTNPGTIKIYKGKQKIKEKNKKYPLSIALSQINNLIMNAATHYNWYKFDTELLSLMNFRKKLSTKESPWIDPETTFLETIQKKYKDTGNLEISKILQSCLVYPNIDKAIKKNIGIELFSCKSIKADYKAECSDPQGTKKDFYLDINKTESATYVCDNSKWRPASDKERFICKEGAPDTVYQISSYYNNEKVSYTCENNIPRLSNDFEAYTGTYCSKEKQDLCINQVICDNGEWRNTTSYSECKVGACNASRYEKTIEERRIICNGKKWRDMEYSEDKYGICDFQKEGQVRDNIICENYNWRKATDPEIQQGLCTKAKLGTLADLHDDRETIPNGYVCGTSGWKRSNKADINDGICSTDKLGQISDDYAYVCTKYGWVEIHEHAKELGSCNKKNYGEIDSSYYNRAVCEYDVWRNFSYEERIVKKYCSAKNIGKLSQELFKDNAYSKYYYVCDGNTWRYILLAELKIGICNSNIEGQKFIQNDENNKYWKALSYDMICKDGEAVN